MIQCANGKTPQVKGGFVPTRNPFQPVCEHPFHARPVGGTIKITRDQLGQIDLPEPLRKQSGRVPLGIGMELQMQV